MPDIDFSTLTFSESSGGDPWHLRRVGADGPCYDGGRVGLISLCGSPMGWDREYPVTNESLARLLVHGRFCRECCNQLNADPIRAARLRRWGLSEQEFNDIFNTLQELFGVSESIRHSLWSEIQDLPDGGFEFRIQGKLGFGGKFWYDPYRGYYVNSYREDLTQELADKIKLMNEFLTVKLSRGLK